MNIDELEKLARAAQGKDYTPVWEFIQAANPAAILELISINRELVAALKSQPAQPRNNQDFTTRWGRNKGMPGGDV